MTTYLKKTIEFSLKAKKTNLQSMKVQTPLDATTYIRQLYSDDVLIYESVFIIFLNRANNIIGYAKISQGGLDSSIIDIRLIAKYAIDTLAVGVIIVHNHPTGNLQPSPQDRRITDKIKHALLLFDIMVLDHIIFTDGDYYSFNENGDL